MVYRDDYSGVLRKLTRQQDATPYIRMLQRAFEFSSFVYGDDMAGMEQYLNDCNAFMEHSEGNLKIVKRE